MRVLAGVLALVAVFWSGGALACSCREITLEQMSAQPVIVRGWVTSMWDSSADMGGWETPVRVVDVQVNQAWRGSSDGARLRVLTPRQGSMCGFPFQLGREYVVYAGLKDGQAWTSICSGTSEWRGQQVISEVHPPSALRDTSLAYHSTPGVWFMHMRIDCDEEGGMQTEITDPSGKVLCPLDVGNPGATVVANRCDCLVASFGPREGISGSSFVSAASWRPQRGKYRIRVRGLATCRIAVGAGAQFSRIVHWAPTDSLTIKAGEELTWSVEWRRVRAGDSTRVTLRRSSDELGRR